MNQYGILTGVSYALCLSILIHEFLWFINNVLRQYYTFATVFFVWTITVSLTQGHFGAFRLPIIKKQIDDSDISDIVVLVT